MKEKVISSEERKNFFASFWFDLGKFINSIEKNRSFSDEEKEYARWCFLQTTIETLPAAFPPLSVYLRIEPVNIRVKSYLEENAEDKIRELCKGCYRGPNGDLVISGLAQLSQVGILVATGEEIKFVENRDAQNKPGWLVMGLPALASDIDEVRNRMNAYYPNGVVLTPEGEFRVLVYNMSEGIAPFQTGNSGKDPASPTTFSF